ncbi:hypothetical protein [Psychrobacter sp. P11G5]|uniref:hypothetical protein n=1 Tax=Psychrobacter sp. P11G5 TaxID=1699624 RepID=UPI000AEC1F6A|nr:hypothetical protein [Psychrobacter sp. P11G5]
MTSDDDMPSVNFTVKYDGEAIRDHEMDVALLAPALLGMQKILEELVKSSTQGEYKTSLKIKGNAREGSIEVELVMQAVSNLSTQVVDFLSGKYGAAGANLTTIISGGIGSLCMLYSLVKKFGNEKPEKITRIDDDKVQLHFKSETVIVNQHIYNIYNNFEVRESLYKTVRPLEKEGIKTFDIIKDSLSIVHIDQEEIGRFLPPRLTESLLLNEETTFLQIKAITFDLNNKWSFTRGDETIKANIIDPLFVDKVYKRDVSFSEGDILQVRLEKEQYMENAKLKTSYKILEVLDHIKGSQQINLDL